MEGGGGGGWGVERRAGKCEVMLAEWGILGP